MSAHLHWVRKDNLTTPIYSGYWDVASPMFHGKKCPFPNPCFFFNFKKQHIKHNPPKKTTKKNSSAVISRRGALVLFGAFCFFRSCLRSIAAHWNPLELLNPSQLDWWAFAYRRGFVVLKKIITLTHGEIRWWYMCNYTYLFGWLLCISIISIDI